MTIARPAAGLGQSVSRTLSASPRPRPMSMLDFFYCRARRRQTPIVKCLDDYVDANAFGTRRAACWRCPQGRRTRETYGQD